MTWRDLPDALGSFAPAAPVTAWLMWRGDLLGALMWLGIYLLAVAALPPAQAVGRLTTRIIDRLAA